MYKKDNLQTFAYSQNTLSATAKKDFGAAVFVTTLPMQLGAVDYSAAGTLAALNTALLE